MTEFCIVNKKTINHIDEIAKEIGVNTEVVHQVVKKWMETHPVYTDYDSTDIDIDATTGVDNFPTMTYIRMECFPGFSNERITGKTINENGEVLYNISPDGFADILDYFSKILRFQIKWESGEIRNHEVLSKLHEKYYIPKEYSDRAKAELEYYRNRYGLPENTFIIKENFNSTEVTFNEDAFNDRISRLEDNLNFANLFESAEQAQKIQYVLDTLSAKTGLKYKTISEKEAKKILKVRKDISNVNSFVKDNVCYFIEGRKLNVDIASEEMLHPFVASIKTVNPKAFASLLRDARQAFPKLRLEIGGVYKDNVDEELVTQALSRAFRKDVQDNPDGHKLKDLIRNFIKIIKGFFESFINEGQSIRTYFSNIDDILENKIITAEDLSYSIKIDDLAQIINSDVQRIYSDRLDDIRYNEEQQNQNKKVQVGTKTYAGYKRILNEYPNGIIVCKTEDSRNATIERLKKIGFTDDSYMLYSNYEGRPCIRLYEHIQKQRNVYQDQVELTSVIDRENDDPDHTIEEHYMTNQDDQHVIMTGEQLDRIDSIFKRFGDSINDNLALSDKRYTYRQNRDVIEAIDDLMHYFQDHGVTDSFVKLVENDNIAEFIKDLDYDDTRRFITGEYRQDDNRNEYFVPYKQFENLYSLFKFGPIKMTLKTFVGEQGNKERNLNDFLHFLDKMADGSYLQQNQDNQLELFESFKLQTTNTLDKTKAASATLFIGYGRPNTTAFNYMQQFAKVGKSISRRVGFNYDIDENVPVSVMDKVFVYISKDALYDEMRFTKDAIRYALDRGAEIIMDSSDSENKNDQELQRWIQQTFNIKPQNNAGTFNIYQTGVNLEKFFNKDYGKPQSDEQQKYFVTEYEDKDKVYEKDCAITVDEQGSQDVDQLSRIIQDIGPAARIRIEAPNLKELIETAGTILANKDLMLYRIPESERKIFIGDDRNLAELAMKNKLKYSKDKETGEFTIYVYDYTTYLSHDEIKRNNQYDRLFNQSRLKASELSSLSKAAIFKLSDTISQLQQNSSEKEMLQAYLQQDFGDVDFKNMSRIQIINKIGFDNLVKYIKERYFGTKPQRYLGMKMASQRMEELSKMSGTQLNKLNFIYANFNAFIEFGKQQLINLEQIALSQSRNVKTEVNDIIDADDEQEIQEIYGSSLEHWQVGFRQVSVYSGLSQLIKNKINTLYELDGNFDIVRDEYGFEKHLTSSEAVSKMLNFVQYAYDIDDMIAKLKIHLEGNPWLKQILDILEDPNQSQFKSQFYTNFKKYFQTYGILFKDRDGSLNMKIINESDVADDLVNQVRQTLTTKSGHLFTKSNNVNQETIAKLREIAKQIQKKSNPESTESFAEDIAEVFELIDIPHATITEIQASLTKKDAQTIYDKVNALINQVNAVKGQKDLINLAGTDEYKYFARLSGRSINSGFESMSYESGKMRYSYVTPSFLNMYIGKLKGNIDPSMSYEDFMEQEFGQYEWFKKDDKYRIDWLRKLFNDEDKRRILQHKVQISNQGVEYDAKSPIQYIESVVKEFFYDKNGRYAWYRIPIMSNKPSEEYIRFDRIHQGYQSYITKELLQVAYQEIDRILAVMQREKNGSRNKIKNFDGKRGKQFCLLTFLNDNKFVKQYIEDKSNGKEVDNETLIKELKDAINIYFADQIQKTKQNWIKIGFIGEDKSGKLVSPTNVNLGRNNKEIEDSIAEFVYNDTFAAINILEITISDPALYKDAEDIQKRLAQLHAPGIRPDVQAFDRFNGQKFSDGKFRTIFIKDFDNIKSQVLEDLKDVFDKLIAKQTEQSVKKVLEAKRDFLLKAFSETNIADGQGYSSPTSYRKKMGLFGKWGQHEEEVYQRILKNDFTTADLDVAFQPLKPFVYGFTSRQGYNDIMTNIKVGTQAKNSEYLLVMADALLRSGGKTNYLTSIFDFMEYTQGLAKDENGRLVGIPNTKGIDTIQFESAIKTGLVNPIDISDEAIKKFRTDRGIADSVSDETVIKNMLYAATFKKDGSYNTDNVAEMDFNYYSIQQEVPQHFKGEQQQGSQQRILLFAGMNDSDMITINGQEMSVQQAKKQYNDAIRQNIDDSVNQLIDRLKLNSADRITKNVVLSRVLREKILEDTRFDTNLLYAVTVNNQGEFNIPLSDPIQSDMIMKLLNSLIKNDVNKQKVPGGPVVQVSRFGSKQLSIRFKDVEGKILLNEDEFNDYLDGKEIDGDFDKDAIDNYVGRPDRKKAFSDYRDTYRHAVAYMECYAPIYDDSLYNDFVDKDGNIDVKKIEKTNPKILEMVGYRIPTESHYSMIPLKIVGFMPRESGEGIMLPDEFITMSGSDFDIDKLYIMRHSLTRDRDGNYYEPTNQRDINNNIIVDTSFAVLTSPEIMEKLFTPGNFEELKKIGYSIEAARNEAFSDVSENGKLSNKAQRYNSYMTYDSVQKIKDVGYKQKNLIDFNTQVDFHKQNMVAARLIGIFAQANVSHSLCSMLDCELNIPKRLSFNLQEKNGVVHEISGIVKIDQVRGFDGNRTSDSLASLLASSVDAVKDPILNLMNINVDTANVVTTLLRLGFSIETCALICSQQAIIDVVNRYNRENAMRSYKKSLTQVINARLKELNTDIGYLSDYEINRNMLKNGMFNPQSAQDEVAVLKLFRNIIEIGDAFRDITHLTRYNSITSAVGPTTYKTILNRMRDDDFMINGLITESTKNQILSHPILDAFRTGSYDVEGKLLGQNLIQDSTAIQDIFTQYGELIGKYEDRFDDFGNFFMSYIMMVDNGTTLHPVFDLSDDKVNYLLNEFPGDVLELKKAFPENEFIKAIQYRFDRGINHDILSINKKAVDPEVIASAWIDLYNADKQKALDLVQYAYLIGSFSFSPKTFMSYLPNYIKQRMDNYIENISETGHNLINHYRRMIDQFMALNEISANKIPVNLTPKDNDNYFNVDNFTIHDSNILEGVSKASVNGTQIWVYLENLGNDTFKVTQIYPDENNSFFNIDPTRQLPNGMYTPIKDEHGKTRTKSIMELLTESKDNSNDDDLFTNEDDDMKKSAIDIFEETMRNAKIGLKDLSDMVIKGYQQSDINRIRNNSNLEVLQSIDFENPYIQQMFETFFKSAEESIKLNQFTEQQLSRIINDTIEEFKTFCIH